MGQFNLFLGERALADIHIPVLVGQLLLRELRVVGRTDEGVHAFWLFIVHRHIS